MKYFKIDAKEKGLQYLVRSWRWRFGQVASDWCFNVLLLCSPV